MIAKILPRALRRITIFKLTSLITVPRCNFAATKGFKEQNNQKAEEDRIYMQEQESSSWTHSYGDIVSDYPFFSIPIGIIRNPAKFTFNEDEIKNLIAFKSINARPADVELAGKILFPDEDVSSFEQINGRQLFSVFMEPKLSQKIRSLNKGDGSLNQQITSLIILNNIDTSVLSSEKVQKIGSAAIIKHDQSGILLSFYVQLLIRHNLNYTPYLSIIFTKLEDSNLPIQVRLKIAKAIFTTPNFEESYSRKILDAAINVVTLNVGRMHNYELLFIIRNVYNYSSAESKKFADSVQNYLIQKHVDGDNLDYHIPLILKTVRYCSRLGLSTKELLEFITKNMKRFQVIFDRKRISKGVFFSLLFTKSSRQVSPELAGHLKSYFLEGLSHFIESKQSQQNEILRFNKLLLKYFDYFSEKQQEYIKSKYIQKMIPYYAESNEILYYSILVYLRVKNPIQGKELTQDEIKQQQNLKKYIQMFIQRCCTKNSTQQLIVQSNINQVIEMVYQIFRNNLKFNRHELPQICKYDFTQKETLKPQILNYFFYYLTKTSEKKEAIKNVLQTIEPLLQTYIRKDRLNSIKTILCIIDVCDRVGFEHNFFYKAIENAIVNFLFKFPKFIIIEKDLKFLNEKLIKRGYGSQGLRNLIVGTLEKPRNWQSNRRTYVDNEKQFKEKIDRRRRQQRNARYHQ